MKTKFQFDNEKNLKIALEGSLIRVESIRVKDNIDNSTIFLRIGKGKFGSMIHKPSIQALVDSGFIIENISASDDGNLDLVLNHKSTVFNDGFRLGVRA